MLFIGLYLSKIRKMEANHIYVYLFDGYSDWEIGYLMPELRQDNRYTVLTVSDTGADVVSMGGMKVSVDASLADIDPANMRLLVLVGGQMWEENTKDFTNLDSVVYGMYQRKLPIAAICGATLYLAHKGMLDQVQHTSNALFYMQGLVSSYQGEAKYVNEPSVTDEHIITATGIAPIEFTREIMKELNFNEEYINRWYQLFKYGIFPTA